MTEAPSPYSGLLQSKWRDKTVELVDAHPLGSEEIVEVVTLCWASIFQSKIGPKGFRIGKHLFPKPQIMGFFLHELIPLEFESRYPGIWRGDAVAGEKDLVYVPDHSLSVEIKTSSHPSQIFGNRSYTQPAKSSKKTKTGYYLAINFQKLAATTASPKVRRIRFGWLDHTDWIGQAAATGQQARLNPVSEQFKLLTLYPLE